MKADKLKRLVKEFVGLDSFDREKIICMLKADDMQSALSDIQDKCFRPARKHLYQKGSINNLIEDCGVTEDGYNRGCELISKLEEIYINVLEDNEVIDLI